MALYGLTHVSLDDTGQIITARVRGISPTMPTWMGKPMDIEASALAALIGRANKVVAIFDITEDRPRSSGGTFRPLAIGGQLMWELSQQTPGKTLRDLPRIEPGLAAE